MSSLDNKESCCESCGSYDLIHKMFTVPKNIVDKVYCFYMCKNCGHKGKKCFEPKYESGT